MLERRPVSLSRAFFYAVALHGLLVLAITLQFQRKEEKSSRKIHVALAYSPTPTDGAVRVPDKKELPAPKLAQKPTPPKPVEPKKEEPKKPEPKKEEPKKEEPKKPEPKPEPPKPDPKKEEPKKPEPKPEPAKPQPKKEEPKKPEPKPEPPKPTPPKPEEKKPEPPKKEDPLKNIANALEKEKEKKKNDDKFASIADMLNNAPKTPQPPEGGPPPAAGADEANLIKSQIMQNWQVPVALVDQNLAVEVLVRLRQDGTVISVTEKGGTRNDPRYGTLRDSVWRAVYQSAPFTGLPDDTYDGSYGWNQVIITFSPSDAG
ncbi:MAG: TonB C-terminal domain-containing protein [Rickettsiales bacterium]